MKLYVITQNPSRSMREGFLVGLAGTAETARVGENHTDDNNNRNRTPDITDNFLRSFMEKETHIYLMVQ